MHDEVGQQRRDRREAAANLAGQLREGVHRLHALRGVGWADRHRHVVLALADVVEDDLLAGPGILDLLIERLPLLSAVRPENAHHALRVEHLRDHVDEDLVGEANALDHIVEVVERRIGALRAARVDCLATRLVRPCAQARVELPGRGLHVVVVHASELDQRGRNLRRLRALRHVVVRRLVVDRQIGEILGVRLVPHLLVALDPLFLEDVGCLRSLGDGLDHRGSVQVVEALLVLAEADRAREVVLALDVVDVAPHRNQRDELRWELVGFRQPFPAVGQAHVDLVPLDLARLDDLDSVGFEQLARLALLQAGALCQFVGEVHAPVAQRPQIPRDRLLVPILGALDLPALVPVGAGGVVEESAHVGVGVVGKDSLLRHQLLDEGEAAVAAVDLHGRGVEGHRERVPHRADEDVLLEVVIVPVVGADAPHAETALHRELGRDVVGALGVGLRLDVAAQALHELGQSAVAFLGAAHLPLRPVLLDFVDDADDHQAQLRELVHRAIPARRAEPFIPLVPGHAHEAHVIQRLGVEILDRIAAAPISLAHDLDVVRLVDGLLAGCRHGQ